MAFFGSLFAPSLLRALVGRTVGAAVVALVLLAAVALYESNDLVTKQFKDEANIVASTAANQIQDQAALMQRAASLIAGLPTTRELTQSADKDGLTAFLLPQKSRLNVDIMNVANAQGVYIAGAQDFKVGETLRPELLALTTAGAQQSWVLYDEPEGLVIRAIYVIRGNDQEIIGVSEVGSVLGNDYLKKIKWIINEDRTWKVLEDGKVKYRGKLTVDPAKKPKTIDSTLAGDQEGTVRSIYELKEDSLKHCFAVNTDRPKAFESKSGSGYTNSVFKRMNKQ